MQQEYLDDVPPPEQPYFEERLPPNQGGGGGGGRNMKPLETIGYNDSDDVERNFHHDAAYTEDSSKGRSGVMRGGATVSSSGKRGCCQTRNKLILAGGIFLVVVVLLFGVIVNQKKKKTNNSSVVAPAPVQPVAPAPTLAPVGTPAPAPFVQPTWFPTPTPMEGPPPDFTHKFHTFSLLLFPPPRDDTLPAYVNPDTAFGHNVAMDYEGQAFVVAEKSAPSDPSNYYGGFHLYRWDTADKQYLWRQTVFDTLAAPPTTAQHHQSLSYQGGRVAFSQGNEVAVYYQTGIANQAHLVPLSNNIKNFGTVNASPSISSLSWYASQIALSNSGKTLAVLLSNEEGQPGMVEIYRDNLSHTQGGLVDSWDFKARIPLSSKVSGGRLAFGNDDLTLAVGTFDDSGDIETLTSYSTSVPSGETWTPAGYPHAVGDALAGSIGGSVFSLSADGNFLAIGSRNGALNEIVLLKWDPTLSEWAPYGDHDGDKFIIEGKVFGSKFGAWVEFNNDGTRVFVGDPGDNTVGTKGKVYAYGYDDSCDCWNEISAALESDAVGDSFGSSFAVDKSADVDNLLGMRILVGMPNRLQQGSSGADADGAVRMFELKEL